MPGFNDAHQHLLPFGMALTEIDLRPEVASTMHDLLERVGQQARTLVPGAWLVGGRYDHFKLAEKRHPTREELDKAAPDTPVYLRRACGHVGMANSRALALAGISDDTPDPAGGEIERAGGRVTGLLKENAQKLVNAVIPKRTRAELVNAIEAGGKCLLAHGVTSVMDAMVGGFHGYDELQAYREAHATGRLPVRSYLSLTGGPGGIQARAHGEGLMTGDGDDMLTIGSIKLFTDGSIGGKTAAMNAPYVCDCGNRGMFIYPDGDLDDLVATYHRQGYQVSLHAIGDAAIGQAIAAVARAQTAHKSPDRRHRIEHGGFTTPAQVTQMLQLGM
ncbi:MAG: amidohydrolase, partial [Pseudomonadota bacterium]